MDLQDGSSFSAANVVNHSLSSLRHILSVKSIHKEAGDAVVLPLIKDVAVLCNIRSEGVDCSSIINDDNKEREVVLGRCVQNFSHATILRTSLSNENNTNSVIISRWRNILFLETFVIRHPQLPVHQDALCGPCCVGKLLRHKGPATLKVCLFVKNVHRPTSSFARSSLLHEKLSHDSTAIHSTCNGMCMLPVVRVLLVSLLDSIINKSRNAFLAIVKMHETTNFALHVLLVTCVFKATRKRHGFVQVHESFFAVLDRAVVFGNFFRTVPEGTDKLFCDRVPCHVYRRAHDRDLWFGLRFRRCF
mmetsp:Transcript_10894/g.22799  ORF Transcript_10894/g.22799 Transcript_10894/m.22799 type:complete len:304 (+) Transcript_10894:1744-2655(+)